MAKAAYAAGDFPRAMSYAGEALDAAKHGVFWWTGDAVHQGNIILAGDFPASLYWKVPLTYCVPFCVATTGALLNARFYFRAEREGEYTDVSREAAGPHV